MSDYVVLGNSGQGIGFMYIKLEFEPNINEL